MDTREVGSVRFAAIVLLVLSGVRWGLAVTDGRGGGRTEDVLPLLAADASAAVAEADRARRPLAEGERIDPNRADAVELDRLPGVGPATARAIVEARERGIAFRTPEDLEVVRGLGPRSVERLRDVLDFPALPSRSAGARRGGSDVRGPARAGVSEGARGAEGLVDLNRASAHDLAGLPGVGPVLAERIVAERRRRPFDDLDDLVRVQGVGQATVERLRGRADAGPAR